MTEITISVSVLYKIIERLGKQAREDFDKMVELNSGNILFIKELECFRNGKEIALTMLRQELSKEKGYRGNQYD